MQPIAARLREREEQIAAGKRSMMQNMTDLVVLAGDQGRDILLAKTKLGKALRWSDWLGSHVPNLPESQAAKYERVATEQLTDPRQCVFAFLPPAEHEPKAERLKPAVWERSWGLASRLTKVVDGAPDTMLNKVRTCLEPMARRLWPDKFA